ncbi:MAG: serine/threonine protein kinase [Gemmatimonadaceae bacterium]|nr:serine/threonine protein kinase [Gemmatimonadaceae bacterium]
MDAERWQVVQDLFHRVADLAPEERQRVLDEDCRGDDTLRAEVERLVASDAQNRTLLDADVAHVVHSVIGGADSASRVPDIRCGPYRLLRMLGEGGMGVVYLARRDDLGSDAAVKLLRDAWASPARRERFVAEQRTLAQLHHPAIAHLYDAGALPDGTPWIAMEFVEGTTLTDHCAQHRLPLRERLRLLRAVAEAVLHAHQQLVIHRDLKPSNILVRVDGTVKLVDFGIAKQLEPGDTPDDVTRTGLRLMTPAYAAPEQVQGMRVGVQTDVYSVGVLLYELLTGVLPFDLAGRTPREAEALITASDPLRPSARARLNVHGKERGHTAAAQPLPPVEARDSEWDDLDVLVLTAMHKDPSRRYRSIDAFLRDLDHFLAGEPLDARGDSLGYRAATFVRRNARGVAVAAAAVVAIVALTTFYTIRLAQARDRALAESVRTQRIQRFITTLFQGGDEAAGPAESLRVATLLDQGVVEARALDLEPRVQADLYETLGGIYAQMGVLDRADSLLATGLAQWQRIAGARSEEAARAMVRLGDLRTSQARYDEGERLIGDGLRTLQGAGADDGVTVRDPVVEARVALGRAFTERGQHARAIATLDSLVTSLRQTRAEPNVVHQALGELANAHFYAGNYDNADSLNRQVLALTRTLFGARHPRVAEDLMNLGATEQERGNYAASESLFRQALDISTAFYGSEHFRTAGNLTYLGRALLLQNRYDEARVPFEKALAIRERVFGPSHPFVANTLNELGNLALRQERYDDAVTIFTRVRDIYARTYPGMNFRTGVATANMADAYLYQKKYALAEPMYRQALEHYIASQGPDHLNTGIGYIKLGRVLLRSGRFREAIPETERGYGIVKKITAPNVSFLQAARLDLSLALDSLGRHDEAVKWRAEREQFLPKPTK